MKRQHLPQRLLAWLLTCVLVFTCTPQALADDSAQATTMQLQKTEGTVDISTSTGKSVPTRNSLRLYNGYGLETDEASYAWINLDHSKLVKEDAVSEISIRKSGKKLDILVDSGNLFFNVSEPLEDDESLNIHTSTMVVGVRGTCGWAKVVDQWTSQIYILEGTVEVSVTDPVTGETKTDTVRGGETATCVVYPQDRPGAKCDILRDTYEEKDIDGFVLVELTPDVPMCDKIYNDSGLDLRRPNLRPRDRLKQDQAEVREKLGQIEDQLQEQEDNTAAVPVWPTDDAVEFPAPNTTTPSDSDDDSNNNFTGGGSITTPTETITLTMPQTAETVNRYLARGTVRQVVLVPGPSTVQTYSARASTENLLDVDSTLTVPSGKRLTLQAGVDLSAPDGSLLTVRGTLTADSSFYLGSDLGAGSQNGTIRAKLFSLLSAVESWEASDTADSAGFYTLIYTAQELPAYTVTFNPAGGSVTPATAATVNGVLTTLPTPTRDGYTFGGWFTAPEGGTQITGSYVFSGDATVYAHWTEGSTGGFTVTFDANGGTVTPTTATTDENGFVDWPTPTRDNVNYTSGATQVEKRYVFDGWYSHAEYGYNIEEAGVYADMTVYAHWLIELNIFGNGAMADYTYSTSSGPDGSSNVPWFDERQLVAKATIEDGVTSIGNCAFNHCINLTSVTIPDSVTRIGGIAFQGCRHLTSVNIPYGVTDINLGTFNDCDSLTSITIPNSVTHIGNNAFRDCDNLTNITIPNSVTSIDWSAFAGSGLTSVTVPGSITDMQSAIFAGCLDMSNAIISDGITVIADGMFDSCRNLTSITIPDSVTSIGYDAFSECIALTDIYFGGTRAQWDALNCNSVPTGCTVHCTDDGGETGVTWRIDGTTLYIEGSGRMENYASYDARPWHNESATITRVIIEKGVTSIGSYAFWGCVNLTDVTIPTSVTFIGLSAFWACGNLTSLTIPASVTSIGMNAFFWCNSLADIYYTGTEAQWRAMRGLADADIRAATIHYNTPSTASEVYNAAPGVYIDVPTGAWYREAAYYCLEHDILDGTSANEFSPDAPLTRGVLVSALHRLAGRPAADVPASFDDVPPDHWCAEAVAWASFQGIDQGRDGVNFGVDDPVTHQQAELMFQRFTGGSGVSIPGADQPQAPTTRSEIASALMDCARQIQNEASGRSASAINVMCSPVGIAQEQDGSLLVTDIFGKHLWRVRSRVGTVFAGGETVQDLYGQPLGGYHDAALTASHFRGPWAVVPFLNGWAVSDTENNVVRFVQGDATRTLKGATQEKLKVTKAGVVFDRPTGLAVDEGGNLYVSDTGSGAIRKITPKGEVITVAKSLSEPMGLCWRDGVLYIAEAGRNRILTLKDGTLSALAGNGGDGLVNGKALSSSFSAPQGVAVGSDGSVYVADTGNGAVRRIRGGVVTTLAEGEMMTPKGLLLQDGNLFVCDSFARKIFLLKL